MEAEAHAADLEDMTAGTATAPVKRKTLNTLKGIKKGLDLAAHLELYFLNAAPSTESSTEFKRTSHVLSATWQKL